MLLKLNSPTIETDIQNNLAEIREAMDVKTHSPYDQSQKLENLICLLGMACDTRAAAFHLCAMNERIMIDKYKLSGNSRNRDAIRHTAYENTLYEYSNTILDSLHESIGALRTLVSYSKKETL